VKSPSVLVKGGEIDLTVEHDDGREHTLVLPTGYGMIHDPSGRSLDKCSLFFGPIVVTQERIKRLPKSASQYFGDDYDARKARIDVPAGRWKSVGRVKEIIYYRPGAYEGDWHHEFSEPQPLDEQGRWYRMKLPRDCRVTWRGIERP
jgi:hypothetical protein